MIKAQSTQRKQ